MAVINTNITSMIGQQNLNKSQNDLSTSMERLSSGLRINSAKDDAAGQAIANRMSSQVTGLNQASRNANDGISLAQTAEGALDQVNDNLQRVRELTVQAKNDTNTQADIDSINKEINQRFAEIDRVTSETSFNGKELFADGGSSFNIQVGADDGQQIAINIGDATGWNSQAPADDTTPTAFDPTAVDSLETLDTMIGTVDTARSDLGAVQNRFETAIENINTTSTNLSSARSRIEDADYAVEVSNMTRAQILQQAGTSILSQANQVPQGVLSLLG